MTKTFNIGEHCIGGILTITINKGIKIDCKYWDTKQIFKTKTFEVKKYDCLNETNTIFEIEEWLNDLTSSYYVSNILDYIEAKIPSIYLTNH